MSKTTFSPLVVIRFRALCSWSRECNSPLCPLDPDLEQKSPPKLTPFCYWYLKTKNPRAVLETPELVLLNLSRYVLHLSKLGVRDPLPIRMCICETETPPRIDNLGKVKGIV
ncbi:hypothetical protein ES705_10490 [subsurface metagenome]